MRRSFIDTFEEIVNSIAKETSILNENFKEKRGSGKTHRIQIIEIKGRKLVTKVKVEN